MTNRIAGDDVTSAIAIVKGDQRYVIIYQAETRADALRQLGHWASNPELDFTWYDAALGSQKIRSQAGTL